MKESATVSTASALVGFGASTMVAGALPSARWRPTLQAIRQRHRMPRMPHKHSCHRMLRRLLATSVEGLKLELVQQRRALKDAECQEPRRTQDAGYVHIVDRLHVL